MQIFRKNLIMNKKKYLKKKLKNDQIIYTKGK